MDPQPDFPYPYFTYPDKVLCAFRDVIKYNVLQIHRVQAESDGQYWHAASDSYHQTEVYWWRFI